MSYTREQWARDFLHQLGNHAPHPYLIKYITAWTIVETAGPENFAANNLLNTTEPGFGACSDFNADGVKNYPSYEDGIAANAAVLNNGRYPNLVEAFVNNHGENLIQVTAEIVKEMGTWSGGSDYAATIAMIAWRGDPRFTQEFPGRRAGQQ